MFLDITSMTMNTNFDNSNNLYDQTASNVHWQWNSSVIFLSAQRSTNKDRRQKVQTILQVTRQLWLWRQNSHSIS